MKKNLISIFIIIFSFQFSFSQTVVKGNFSMTKSLHYYLLNKLDYLEVNKYNRIRFECNECKTRYLSIAIDSSQASVITNWRPISTNKNWNDLFAEYTLITAKKFGAYHQNETSENLKYQDNEHIYWVKDFDIKPKTEKPLNVTIYCTKERELVLIGSTFIKTKN